MLAVYGTDPERIDDRYLLSPLPEGWRALALLDDRVRLRSRSGRDLATDVPGLVAALAPYRPPSTSGTTTVLDVLLVRPRCALPEDDVPVAAAEAIAVLDLLCCAGHDVTGRDLQARRAALAGLRIREGERLSLVPAWRGSARAILEQGGARDGACRLLARRAAAPYRPGRRSRDWIELGEQRLWEHVLCGITAGGALVLGMATSHGLVFAGTTWPTRHWSRLAVRCTPADAPFPEPPIWGSLGHVAWAKPELWIAVAADVRATSGRGGPRWRFVRVAEDLAPRPASVAATTTRSGAGLEFASAQGAAMGGAGLGDATGAGDTATGPGKAGRA